MTTPTATTCIRENSTVMLLPPLTRESLLQGQRGGVTRPDLVAIIDAEAAGWTVTFPDNDWRAPATFRRNGVVVWSTGQDIRRTHHINASRYSDPEILPLATSTMRQALGLP